MFSCSTRSWEGRETRALSSSQKTSSARREVRDVELALLMPVLLLPGTKGLVLGLGSIDLRVREGDSERVWHADERIVDVGELIVL